MPTAGYILTGGRSSRMGRDKALLPWNGTTVAEHLAEMLRPFANPVTLIGEPSRYAQLNLPCLADLRPGLGPLAGLETALSTTKTDWNLILPCDVPQIDATILRQLLAPLHQTDVTTIVLRDGTGQMHPLCALYHRDCLAVVQRALNAGELRVMSVVETLRPVYVNIPRRLRNLNTPEEWEAANTTLELTHGQ